MLWQDDKKKVDFIVDDSVMDLIFNIECKTLPVDHICALSKAIVEALPESISSTGFGLHAIHLAGSQNGWERPDENLGQNLILSKRTKLKIRCQKEHIDLISSSLIDVTLDINGFPLTIKKAKTKKLEKLDTIFSRNIVCSKAETEDEDLFLERIQKELDTIEIKITKALCGMVDQIKTPDGAIHTRSLMIADLSPENSIKIQQLGIGSHREMGCGIFIPHKGIDAVGESTDD